MGVLKVGVLVLVLSAVVHARPESIPGPTAEERTRATISGKYDDLIATFEIPEDQASMGALRDHGYWGGGTYRGIPNMPAGYYVYVAPTWFVWGRMTAPRGGQFAQPPGKPQQPPQQQHQPPPPPPKPLPPKPAPAPPPVPVPAAIGWPEYDELAKQLAETQGELNLRNREVVAQYGRNDGPEALAILQPLRDRLKELEAKKQRVLVCEGEPIANPAAMFTKLKIAQRHLGAVDQDSLKAYVESRYMDGTITKLQKERFFVVVSLRTRGVMNPSSRGAGQIASAIAGTLRCFRIDTPSTGVRKGAPARTSEPLLLAKKFASDQRVGLYSYRVSKIGNTAGHFAPIVVLPDGGSLIVGTKSDTKPGEKYQIGKSHAVLIRLDARGRKAWEKKFDKKGFMDYEGGGAAPTSDGGAIVFVLSYVHPGRGAVARFVKLDKKGRVLWDRQLRGNGSVNTPFPSRRVQLTAAGTVILEGHIYLDNAAQGRRTEHGWTGEIDAKGKLIADQVINPSGMGGASYGGSQYGGWMYGGWTYGGFGH